MVNANKISMKKIKELSSKLREKLDDIDLMIDQKEDKNKICTKMVHLMGYIGQDIVATQSNEWKGDYLSELADIVEYDDIY